MDRRRTEIHVEGNILRARSLEPVQQLRVEPAWPRPDADFLDRGRVDRNDDDLTAGVVRLPGEPQIRQDIA